MPCGLLASLAKSASMTIAEEAGEPRFYRVKRHLVALADELAPGAALPTERELTELFSTSRTTVRQAMAELATEGRLERRQGSGTYVAEPKVTWPLEMASFTQQARSSRLHLATSLLAADRVAATPEVASALQVAEGAPVYRIERVRVLNGTPMALELTHLDAARFPGLVNALRKSGSLYAVLQERWHVMVVEATQTIETAPASQREANILVTTAGAPLLVLGRHSFGLDGEPIEFVRSWYRGDRYTLVAKLGPS